MGKTTKRSRKFAAKGGVKGMLEKGTITKKGKLKMKRRGGGGAGKGGDGASPDADDAAAARRASALAKKRDEDDFAGTSNVGDLDMDSFFRSVADETEKGGDSGSDGHDDAPEDDDDDDDHVGSVGSAEGSDDESDDVGSRSDEEDDVEAAELRMKEEMAKLQQADPEFHKYLQDHEKSLLEFGEYDDEDERNDDETEDIDADADAEMDDVGNASKKATAEKKQQTVQQQREPESPHIHLTAKLLKSYEQGAFASHGIKGLRRIVSAYKAACHLADPSQNEDGSGRLVEPNRGKKSYHIDSSTVFDRLMVICLRKCHEEFCYHLLGKGSGQPQAAKSENCEDEDGSENQPGRQEEPPTDESKPLSPRLLAKSKRWKEMQSIMQLFLKSTLHLLAEAKEPNLLKFILQSLSKYVPYLTAFPRIAKALLKTCNNLWSATADASEDYQVVRLNAFVRIRQLAITQPFPFIEDCLKATYLAYAKRSKFGTAASVATLLPTLTFLGNCVVELYSLDYASSYQHAFVYIRQLALHLRTALQKKTPEALRVVYCWQYMHCLKLWVAVLSSSCGAAAAIVSSGGGKDDEAQLLRSLIFPLTEIILGVARLVPTARHLPLRLHCVRLLQQLASSSVTFIPTTSILLEVFDLKELYMRPKRVESRGTDVRGVRLPLILKLPKEGALRTTEQLEACLSELFVLLNREIDLYRFSAGFPEFTIRITQRLRKFNKESKNGRWRAYSKGCIELCERHSSTAVQARSCLVEAPKDVSRLEVLKPPNVSSMRDRYEAAVAKENRLEAVSKPAVPKAANDIARTEADGQKKPEGERRKEQKDHHKKKRKKRRKREVNEADLKNVGALEEEDEVHEGIVWSDDEGERMVDE